MKTMPVLSMMLCILFIAGLLSAVEHDGHADEGHDDHDDHADGKEDDAEVARGSMGEFGLSVAVAGSGNVSSQMRLPGELVLNPDQIVHVVPRAAGIVREVKKGVGDRIKQGEIIAWIESAELAEVKLAYFDKLAEVACFMIELPRAKEIFNNTTRLLELLETDPSHEEIKKLDSLEMGEYRGRILTAYVQYLATKAIYDREKLLHSKNIVSEQQLFIAETAFIKAGVDYQAAMDIAKYGILIAYGEAARERQVAEFEVVVAEQRLRLKGGDDKLIESLQSMVPDTASLKPCLCDDPNCEEGKIISVLDTIGKNKRFAWYPIKAPFAGLITEKHLTLGELVSGEESVVTIANTDTVWANLAVFQRDAGRIHVGMKVAVLSEGGEMLGEGNISFISPILDTLTRNLTARVILDNKDMRWNPGRFVTGFIQTEDAPASVVVPKTTVQSIGGELVVFVPQEDSFIRRDVTIGRSTITHVEIISGLKPGEKYVATGAFHLKAEIVTSGIDPHAGHGH